MAKRYIPSSRSRSGVSTNAVRDQFMKDLTKEAESLLKTYIQQFSDTLQSQSSSFLQGLFGDGSASASSSGLTSLFSAASTLMKGHAKVTSNTAETDRSHEMESRFKLAQSQSLAEASALISKGDKNL
jgi:hypothetical protein